MTTTTIVLNPQTKGKLVFCDYETRGGVVRESDPKMGALTACSFLDGIYVAAGTAKGRAGFLCLSLCFSFFLFVSLSSD